MRLLILADSHGNLEDLQKIIREKGSSVDFIIHLGDNYSDMEQFNFPNVIKIPGVYDPEYENRLIKHRIIKDFGKIKVLLSHTKTSHPNDFEHDIKPEDVIARKTVKVMLYAHTHLYDAKVEGGILFVNPGHLKREDKKGMPPTYAVVEIDGEKVSARIIALNGEVLKEAQL